MEKKVIKLVQLVGIEEFAAPGAVDLLTGGDTEAADQLDVC